MNMRDLKMTAQLYAQLEKLSNVHGKTSEMSETIEAMRSLLRRYEDEYIDFRLICDHLDSTLFVTNEQGVVLYVNPSYVKKTRLDPAHLIGHSADELNKTDVTQCDVIPRVIREKKPVNGIGYAKGTDYRGFIAGIPVMEDDELKYVVTTDWDTTTIMSMENLLRSLKKGDPASGSEMVMDEFDDDRLLWVSDQMRVVMSIAKTIAKTDVTVLITGETGTGKEVLSNAIVHLSSRADKPFVKVNCAAIPKELIESELFGYEEGAFTGAKKGGKRGAFEDANGGTLFLDEIGELPYQVQAKLLRALQESEITRVGGHKPISLDLRIIAATNRDLLEEIRQGRFREDLYYRLNIIPIELPPLRERTEDIPFIAGRFLEEFNEKYHKTTILESDVLLLFRSYSWPGNVRELRNLMERLVILSADGHITKEEVRSVLKFQDDHPGSMPQTLKEATAQLEIMMIKNAIKDHGSKNKAAAALGIDHSTMVRKCQKYGIE